MNKLYVILLISLLSTTALGAAGGNGNGNNGNGNGNTGTPPGQSGNIGNGNSNNGNGNGNIPPVVVPPVTPIVPFNPPVVPSTAPSLVTPNVPSLEPKSSPSQRDLDNVHNIQGSRTRKDTDVDKDRAEMNIPKIEDNPCLFMNCGE